MSAEDISGSDWSPLQNELIVADYFEMRDILLAGGSVNKLARNRALQALTGRNKSSIEWKRRNISGVLDAFDIPWLKGFRPSENYQDSLVTAVRAALDARSPEMIDPPLPSKERPMGADLIEGPPPPLSEGQRDFDRRLERVAVKYNQAERDARNRLLGEEGERLVVEREKLLLTSAGLIDEANAVEWTSKVRGDGVGFDIQSFTLEGKPRHIEVKTTSSGPKTPFYLSRTERAVSMEKSDSWRLYRVHSYGKAGMGLFVLPPPLEAHVSLRTESWRASFF